MGCGISKKKAKFTAEEVHIDCIENATLIKPKTESFQKPSTKIDLTHKIFKREIKTSSMILLKSPHENPLYIARIAAIPNSTKSSYSDDVHNSIDRPIGGDHILL